MFSNMTDTALADPIAPLRPPEKSAYLETDTFCVECGYNLHAQPVTRDERLGIFICRCPECGRFHPAGTGVTATSTWLRRFATALLGIWVVIALSAIVTTGICMGALHVAHIESYTYRAVVTADGRPAEWKQVKTPGGGTSYQVAAKGTTQPAPTWKTIYTTTPPARDDQNPWMGGRYQRAQRWEEFFVFTGFGAALGLVAGVLTVVFFWHWKKRRYLLTTLLPLSAAAFMIVIYAVNDDFQPVLGYATRVSLGHAAWQAAWMCLGILIGRPVARGILRTIVPPNPRQHFNFLWHADGKKPPPARPSGAMAATPTQTQTHTPSSAAG